PALSLHDALPILIVPNGSTLSPAAFNTTMTMHGVTVIFLFVIPISTCAFGNYLVPLMIGARDMAFPRLNAFSYWVFLGSGLFLYTGVFTGHGPNAGWFDYVPLASRTYNPSSAIDFYALGLIFNSISSTAAAVNFIVTIFKMRAPGMSLNRMPLFCFAFLAVSFALIFALPALSTDLVFLELDRRAGFHFFDIGHGGSTLLWQHLFWIFGHPEVYIIILPAFGIATSIIPTFVRRRMVAFSLVAIPFDQQLTDTYFVVAHFHFVIFGAAVFPILGGMYYWFPKVTGRMYYERLGQASFWVCFFGTLLLFFPMHILGLVGMPRRN